MSKRFNKSTWLWAIGVIQPATIFEVVGFLERLYPETGHFPEGEEALTIQEYLLEHRYVVICDNKNKFMSLTEKANDEMDKELKRLRDHSRISLLRACYAASLKQSDEVVKESVDDSSTIDARTITQEAARPITLERGSPFIRRPTFQSYWPRVPEQLGLKVGLNNHPSGSLTKPYRYYSFPRLNDIRSASYSHLEKDMTLTQLGLCIGVSARLLTSFIHNSQKHYRKFELPKKAGGVRVISTPRFYLKTIQYWIRTYFTENLSIHDACHAFVKGRSIKTNATTHLKKRFVANIDIEDFFGNITTKKVREVFRANGVGEQLSSALSKLTTLDGKLPQGAPTSPSISNAYLYDFDRRVSDHAKGMNLNYSRYADDITISGELKISVFSCVEYVRELLVSYDLNLNEQKTRIASRSGSQRVTGIVVNEKLQPPREYRRKVRAMFHQAEKKPELFIDKLNELSGHLAYLKSFQELQGSEKLAGYERVLERVRSTEKDYKN